jgi:hypothetical protein
MRLLFSCSSTSSLASLLLLVLLLLLRAPPAKGVRNGEAEDHCRDFLTNPATAPITRKSTRDLGADAAAEGWCRAVLADEQLPLQIRSTVMEGLLHLMMEHTRLELKDRKGEAFAMHKALVMEFPDVARFLLHAARYAIEVMGEPEEARTALAARVKDLKQETDEERREVAEAVKLLAWLEKKQSYVTKDGLVVGAKADDVAAAVGGRAASGPEAKSGSETRKEEASSGGAGGGGEL